MTEKSVLYSGKKLIITLFDEGDAAHLTIQSTKHGPDLYNQDDVVVVVDGIAVPVQTQDRLHARADLPDWLSLVARGFKLMVRVGEFFEGWDFGDAIDEEDEAAYADEGDEAGDDEEDDDPSAAG